MIMILTAQAERSCLPWGNSVFHASLSDFQTSLRESTVRVNVLLRYNSG
jgi:hypothetical protein